MLCRFSSRVESVCLEEEDKEVGINVAVNDAKALDWNEGGELSRVARVQQAEEEWMG